MSSINEDTEDFMSIDVDDENVGPRDLRAVAKRGKKALAENEQLRRELAFTKAGINPDDPRMKYFVRGYDGELSADAIKTAALEAGFLQQEAPAPVPVAVEQADFSAQERVMQASAGAVAEDVTEAAAVARLEQAMAEGGVEAMLEVARQYGLPTFSES